MYYIYIYCIVYMSYICMPLDTVYILSYLSSHHDIHNQPVLVQCPQMQSLVNIALLRIFLR